MIGDIMYGKDFLREIARMEQDVATVGDMINGRVHAPVLDAWVRLNNCLAGLRWEVLSELTRASGQEYEVPRPLRNHDEPLDLGKAARIIDEIWLDLGRLTKFAQSRGGVVPQQIPRVKRLASRLEVALLEERFHPLKRRRR